MLDIWNAVKQVRHPNYGYERSSMFIKLPTKKEYPDYYKAIAQPIDMTMIQKNIHAGKYKTLDEFGIDFDLLFNNAQYYNESGSQIYNDAVELQKYFHAQCKLAFPSSTIKIHTLSGTVSDWISEEKTSNISSIQKPLETRPNTTTQNYQVKEAQSLVPNSQNFTTIYREVDECEVDDEVIEEEYENESGDDD